METTQHPWVKILATSAVVIALPLALLAHGMFPEAPPPGATPP